MKYKGFEKEGMKIVAGFDIDPSKFYEGFEIPVLSLDALPEFIRKNGITIGVIAVPDIAAQAVLELMVASGIKGVLNFAPIRLRAGDDIVINNVNLELELENLVYFVNANKRAKSI
jgi:redox-sensing transcriptional repressor